MRRLSEAEKQYIRTALQDGKSAYQITKELKCNRGLVYYYAYKWGIYVSNGRRKVDKFAHIKSNYWPEERIGKYHAEGIRSLAIEVIRRIHNDYKNGDGIYKQNAVDILDEIILSPKGDESLFSFLCGLVDSRVDSDYIKRRIRNG